MRMAATDWPAIKKSPRGGANSSTVYRRNDVSSIVETPYVLNDNVSRTRTCYATRHTELRIAHRPRSLITRFAP